MSRLGKMPSWQRSFIVFSFSFCTLSGLTYFIYPELKTYVPISSSRFILATHGISASFMLIALGLVLPAHLKAGWFAKSNRFSGVGQFLCLLVLTASGLLLYYGSESLRDLTLLTHYVVGFLLIGLFLGHLFIRRKTEQTNQNMPSISLRIR
jgi:hypothetical protein